MTDEVQTQTLDDVLSGKEPATAPVQQDEGGKQEAEPVQQAETPVEEAKPEAQTPSANKEKPEPKEEWTKAAVIDERRKRQQLEREIAELRKQSQQSPRPDVFEDPEGAFRHEREQLTAQIHATRLELTQELMRDAHQDYDELESEFVELAQQNPFLIQELQQARNPAKFAYETAKKARDAAALKDVDKLKADLEAKIRAELEAKIRAEVEESEKKSGKKREALMPSLAAAQSKGAINDTPDESLDSILKKR